MRQRNRLFRATVTSKKPLEVITLKKSSLLRQLTENDVRAYRDLCSPFCDIHKEGMEIVNEMNTKSSIKRAFLDGVHSNMLDNNQRSNGNTLSWLDS